jgi:hypothetical protein
LDYRFVDGALYKDLTGNLLVVYKMLAAWQRISSSELVQSTPLYLPPTAKRNSRPEAGRARTRSGEKGSPKLGYHAPLRCAAASLNCASLFPHHRRFQPSFDVQERPFTRYMSPNGSQQELVVNVVEQALDIKL